MSAHVPYSCLTPFAKANENLTKTTCLCVNQFISVIQDKLEPDSDQHPGLTYNIWLTVDI